MIAFPADYGTMFTGWYEVYITSTGPVLVTHRDGPGTTCYVPRPEDIVVESIEVRGDERAFCEYRAARCDPVGHRRRFPIAPRTDRCSPRRKKR